MSELTVKLAAAVPPNFTDVAPVNPVPLMLTEVPTPPEVGAKMATVGAGINVKAVPVLVAVPPGVVTLIAPLDALPTNAVI